MSSVSSTECSIGTLGSSGRSRALSSSSKASLTSSSGRRTSRLAHLREEQQRLQEEITQIEASGRVTTYQPAQIRERFGTAVSLLRQLQGDFRSVEESFRNITEQVQQRQAQGGDTRGGILEFALDAEDVLKREDRQTGKTVSSYQDSSGQSGGEKAKLAFTILVAAIAYQYDLDPDQPARDRLHFVVVDEMFSKVDDQHAEYALELFRQFGLQLLIVAPLDAKARVTQPYVGCYLHVHKRENRSEVFAMTAQEFDERIERAGLHTA